MMSVLFQGLWQSLLDFVDHAAEGGIKAIARLRERHLDFGRDPARIGGQYEDAVAHQDCPLKTIGQIMASLSRYPLSLNATDRCTFIAAVGPQNMNGRKGSPTACHKIVKLPFKTKPRNFNPRNFQRPQSEG
jgi:hypothetical protein